MSEKSAWDVEKALLTKLKGAYKGFTSKLLTPQDVNALFKRLWHAPTVATDFETVEAPVKLTTFTTSSRK